MSSGVAWLGFSLGWTFFGNVMPDTHLPGHVPGHAAGWHPLDSHPLYENGAARLVVLLAIGIPASLQPVFPSAPVEVEVAV